MRPCYLCKSKERNELKYGEYLTRGNISVHYFCLLLTSNLLQQGHDNEGFLGFLPADIKDEAIRVAPALCCYCKKESANISCCARKCHKSFHLICGVKNECLNQFVGTFQSFCNRHIPGRKIRPPATEMCCICYENIRDENERFSAVRHIQAPCCKNGWFHKSCIASFANSAGYFFKCPLCNDTKLFRERLSRKGIYIPDRDAAWELERNAYAELLERPTKCSARVCKAKGGRTTRNKNSNLIYCGTCGSIAIHRNCMKGQKTNFNCDECASFMGNVENESIVNISASQQNNDEKEEDEDVYVDVCEEDDDSPLQNNSQNQDSDLDESTVQPLGRIKSNVFRIFDDDMTSTDGDDDCESTIDVRQKVHRKSSQTLSSDDKHSIESVGDQRKHSDTLDARSLFDSGAESDRSANSGDKLNFNNSFDESVSYSPQKPESERPQSCCEDEFNTMESLRFSTSYASEKLGNDVDEVEILQQNQNETSRTATRYTSLNDSPSANEFIAKRTRRRSMCAEIALSSLIPKGDVNIKPVSERSCEFSGETKTGLGEIHNAEEVVSVRKSNNFENTAYKTKSRQRSNSDSPINLQNPYSTLPQQKHCKPGEIFNSKNATSKRSRSDSMPDTEISQNKRLRNNSTSGEREAFFFDIHSICKRRSSRGRSPLSSNVCSLYAFITPSYVKNRNSLKQDTPSATDNVVLPTEDEKFFNTNKPNINKPKTEDVAATANKIGTSRTPTTIINYNRSPQETFFNSYSILIESPRKSKPHKPRNKRVFKDYSNQDLPISQTKIESFFKRL